MPHIIVEADLPNKPLNLFLILILAHGVPKVVFREKSENWHEKIRRVRFIGQITQNM